MSELTKGRFPKQGAEARRNGLSVGQLRLGGRPSISEWGIQCPICSIIWGWPSWDIRLCFNVRFTCVPCTAGTKRLLETQISKLGFDSHLMRKKIIWFLYRKRDFRKTTGRFTKQGSALWIPSQNTYSAHSSMCQWSVEKRIFTSSIPANLKDVCEFVPICSDTTVKIIKSPVRVTFGVNALQMARYIWESMEVQFVFLLCDTGICPHRNWKRLDRSQLS